MDQNIENGMEAGIIMQRLFVSACIIKEGLVGAPTSKISTTCLFLSYDLYRVYG